MQQLAGFDCRKKCSHDPKGDHGISGGRFYWILRGDDPRFAFVLVLHADEYPTTVEPHFLANRLARCREVLHEGIILPWPGYLALHSTVPLDKSMVAENDRGSVHGCEYLDNVPCYDGGSWNAGKDLAGVIAHDGGRLLPDQPEAFWAVLEEVAQRDFIEATARADEAAHWMRCPTCNGERIIRGDS
jgi:hypothetical protein